MAFIYILKFTDTGRYYVGSTIDIERRVKQHHNGNTYTTHRLGKIFDLAFVKEVDNLQIARHIERRIKSWKRKDFIEKIISDGRISVITGT